MTLTGQLDDPSSAIAAWARDHLPGTRMLSADLRAQVGAAEAVVPALPRPYPLGFEPGRQSTAHEQRLGASLRRPDLTRALSVASRLPTRHADAAVHAVELTRQALGAAEPWQRGAPWLLPVATEDRLARCFWVLAQLEAGWRRGMHDPSGPLYAGHADGPALLASASEESVQDLVALAAAAAEGPFVEYRETAAVAVTLGPVPVGGRHVGGADGDILVGNTLVEVKTIGALARVRRNDVLQLAFYALLDFEDEFGIRRLALYLGRHALVARWTAE